MGKKKILIFIDWFLPGYKAGGPVRSMANMVDHLHNEYDFYIVTRNCEYLETAPYPNVISNEWNCFKEGVKVWYASLDKLSGSNWSRLIHEIAPDIIYINGIYSFKFSLLPLLVAKRTNRAQIIVAPRGMLASSAIQVKSIKKRFFLMLVKTFRLFRNVNFHVTNAKEGEEARKELNANGRVFIAANLARKHKSEYVSIEKPINSLKLISLARIAPEKNTLFALECLNLITNQELGIQFDLYGGIYNDAYWKLCQDVIAELPLNIKVEYKSSIPPELIGETLAQYHALFLPSRGENFGHVIVESFMEARPVLISDQTPWLGLKNKGVGWDLPLEKPELFARTIEELTQMDQIKYNELCERAHKLAEEISCDDEVFEGYREMLGS